MCLEFDFTYAVQISLRSVNPLSYYIPIYGNRTKPPSGQNPLWPKPNSGQNPPPNPPQTKTPLLQKIPLWPNPPPVKKNILSTPLLSNEYYESYKSTTLINRKLPNLLLLYR